MRRTAEQIESELLILDAQEGRREAFEELVRRWNGRLLRFAWRLTGREDGAKEAVQESWMAIIQGLNDLSDPAAFPAWAYRIVRFKAADYGRKESRERALVREERAQDPLVDSRAALLESLPAEDRAILTLFYLDEFSIEEIAGILDVPGGTVKSRLFYSRSRLKALLERSPR